MSDHPNINFNQILNTLQWFLIAELQRYLCYGILSFLISLYLTSTISEYYIIYADRLCSDDILYDIILNMGINAQNVVLYVVR